jgi:hypothetical protein
MIDQKKPVENTTTLTVSNMSNFNPGDVIVVESSDLRLWVKILHWLFLEPPPMISEYCVVRKIARDSTITILPIKLKKTHGTHIVLSVFIGLCVSWVLLLLLGAYR